jgi:hypothetical protein
MENNQAYLLAVCNISCFRRVSEWSFSVGLSHFIMTGILKAQLHVCQPISKTWECGNHILLLKHNSRSASLLFFLLFI